MSVKLLSHCKSVIDELRSEGLYKDERQLITSQGAEIKTRDKQHTDSFLNLCANNYLGLADNPELIEAAKSGLDNYGLGMASVRFICGTQDIHKSLEQKLAQFLGTEDSILFSSCFDANAGIFEVLLGDEDAIISDALNHASIIDGVRLCKAQRFRYANNDMAELEKCLIDSQNTRFRLIVTDGVFSMDGVIADLQGICNLAEKYDAMVMVDDSHAVGFMGERGAGTPEFNDVEGRVQILSGTFGKALGGASGGYIAGPAPIIELLRQRARPYLFSNSLPPAIVQATLHALNLVNKSNGLRDKLKSNSGYFREQLEAAGFTLAGADHPIIPVMIGDAIKAQEFARSLHNLGIYVTAFSFPVVPKNKARIRTQISAVHTRSQLDFAIGSFIKVGKALEII